MFLKVKITDNANSLLNLVRRRPCAAMFVLIFGNFTLEFALEPRHITEILHITVLSHLSLNWLTVKI